MVIGQYPMGYSIVSTYALVSLHILGYIRDYVYVNEVMGRYCNMSPIYSQHQGHDETIAGGR